VVILQNESINCAREPDEVTPTQPVAPRVTRRRATTRARLLDAAFEQFASRGFGHTSIEGVCEAAGYTRGAFYSNFNSLDELFFVIYEQRSRSLAGQVAAALAVPHDVEQIEALIERIVTALMIDREWILIKTEFFLYAARNPAAAVTLRLQRENLLDVLANLLVDEVDRTGLPPTLRTPRGLAAAVMAVHDGAMTHLLLDPVDGTFKAWLIVLITALMVHI
jgi:AcrR family transcriptional regulator